MQKWLSLEVQATTRPRNEYPQQIRHAIVLHRYPASALPVVVIVAVERWRAGAQRLRIAQSWHGKFATSQAARTTRQCAAIGARQDIPGAFLSAGSNTATHAKSKALEWIERNTPAITQTNDCLFSFGEPSLEEYESAAFLVALLREGGFEVETGISGFPTAFVGTWSNKGGPVIALHAEYDATPGGSQKSGSSTHDPIVPGAPGHAEGHQANSTVMLASAFATKFAMEELGIAGTLKVFGAPGEELLISRPYFVRDGYFDDVEMAFHNHIRDAFYTEVGQTQIALISAEFNFHGETTHAGLTPWLGRDALDAVILMDNGMAQYREHIRPEMRAHRVITQGGTQPNVTTEKAAVWWYFRGHSADDMRGLFEQAKKIAEGAAMMTRTSLSVDVKSAVWPTRCNRALADVLDRNMHDTGMPAWTQDEVTFARRVQEAAGVAIDGLCNDLSKMRGPGLPEMSSNDCGDISWKVPMGRLWFPGSIPNVHFHHWSAGAMLTTSITHKGIVAAAKVLSGSILECFCDEALRAQIKQTFAEEIDGTTYEPMIPLNRQPTLRPHEALMRHYRPLMAAHYRTERPVFETSQGQPNRD